jgi:hypothetical protein
MNDAKYIGYLESEIANTMWTSGLCRLVLALLGEGTLSDFVWCSRLGCSILVLD